MCWQSSHLHAPQSHLQVAEHRLQGRFPRAGAGMALQCYLQVCIKRAEKFALRSAVMLILMLRANAGSEFSDLNYLTYTPSHADFDAPHECMRQVRLSEASQLSSLHLLFWHTVRSKEYVLFSKMTKTRKDVYDGLNLQCAVHISRNSMCNLVSSPASCCIFMPWCIKTACACLAVCCCIFMPWCRSDNLKSFTYIFCIFPPGIL